MRAALWAACLIAAWAGGAGWAVAETPEELFELGNAAYEDNRFDDAIEAYQTVARYGIHDLRLEYNLGNAYFRMGDLGRSVLHYERARRLSPTDRDVRANLELARSRRFDRVEAQQVAMLVGSMRSLQDRLGPDRQGIAVLVLVWVIAVLVTWMSVRSAGWSGSAGWGLAAVVLAATLIALSWWATWTRLDGTDLAVVLDDAVEVLAGPGPNNATLFTVHEGLTLEVRAERPEWIQVSLPNGLNGWIPRTAIGLV
jgi:tetratricopeptide (TPR) repeat protein